MGKKQSRFKARILYPSRLQSRGRIVKRLLYRRRG